MGNSAPPPPPSFDELFGGFTSTLVFPITAPQFGTAVAYLKRKDVGFGLDETELAHLQKWLTDRPAVEGPPAWTNWIFAAIATCKTFGSPLIAYAALSATIPSGWYLLYGVVPLVLSLLSFMLFGVAGPIALMLSGRSATARMIWVSLLEVFFCWCAFSLSHGHLSFWVSWPLLALVVELLLIPLLGVVVVLIEMAAQRRRQAAHTAAPEAYIACQLFDVFSQAALAIDSPVATDTRRSWAWSLSNVALCLETSLMRALSTKDPRVDAQTQAELRKRASAIRDLAGRVTMGGDLPLDIAKGTRAWMRSACYFNWQALPATDTTPTSEPEEWQKWMRKAARSLIMLILPVGLLLVLRRNWIVLEPGQSSWANAVLAAWIGLILLSMMDPDFEFTNKMLETMNKFPLPGKFGKKE